MRFFVTKQFDRWAQGEALSDAELCNAAQEVVAGQAEADLGGYLFKKRIARKGGGKRGGYRTIIGYKKNGLDRAIFLHGFPKNKKDNINKEEKSALSINAKAFCEATEKQVEQMVKTGNAREMRCTQ